MTRRDRADIEARVEVRPPTSDVGFNLRILLELDRIASALETMISLMDDHAILPTEIVEVPLENRAR